jgi:hypothetical protein
MYQTIIAFHPAGATFRAEFDTMEEAFAAYSECTEKLPSKAGVFVFRGEGEEVQPLVQRFPPGWKKALKELTAANGNAE